MKKFLLVIVSVLAIALGGCESKTDKIVVLTSSGYEPYEIIDTDGNLTGFDIELMEALALEAGVEIEWKDVDFDGIMASIQSGQAEIAIAGISPTEERKEMVDFSDVYYNTESGLTNFFVYDADYTYTSFDDLDGLVVGAQMGTVQASLLESLSTEYNFTLDLRANNTQIIEEIHAGRIDVLVVESIIADSILEINTTLTKTGFESILDDTSGNAMAFAKGSEYVDIFNTALETLKENGTLDTLIAKWFN